MINIPFFGLDRQYKNLRNELLEASDNVYQTGKVLDGSYVAQFENQIAHMCNRKYGIAVNSCTQGLILAQHALNLSKCSVIIPTVSFAATLNSVLMSHNMPIYCDVDRNGILNFDSFKWSPREHGIKALMYVNLFGNVIDYNKLQVSTEMFNDQLLIIEDAAQSFGASYKGTPSGKLGTISVLSFDPTKNLPNYGSGGMVLTDDWQVACNLRNLRNNGKDDDTVGTNSKMSESDCAQMLVKLKYFNQWQQRRKEIAKFYTEHLSDYVQLSSVRPDVEHAWHKFPLWLNDDTAIQNCRSVIQHNLKLAGIETKIHYTASLPNLACNLQNSFCVPDDFPVGETHSKTELSLPIYPELTDLEVEYIVETFIDCIDH